MADACTVVALFKTRNGTLKVRGIELKSIYVPLIYGNEQNANVSTTLVVVVLI